MEDKLLKVINELYPDFDFGQYCSVYKRAFLRAKIYANENLLAFIDEPYLLYLQANLVIHFFIVDPDSPLYDKFSIGKQDFLVTSVSSAGASTSINSIRTLDEGDFLTLDLYRTRWGREAYQIMSSLSGIAIL